MSCEDGLHKGGSSVWSEISLDAAAVRSGKFTEAPINGKLYTEADWNKTSTLLGEPYNLSKVATPSKQHLLSNCSRTTLITIL